MIKGAIEGALDGIEFFCIIGAIFLIGMGIISFICKNLEIFVYSVLVIGSIIYVIVDWKRRTDTRTRNPIKLLVAVLILLLISYFLVYVISDVVSSIDKVSYEGELSVARILGDEEKIEHWSKLNNELKSQDFITKSKHFWANDSNSELKKELVAIGCTYIIVSLACFYTFYIELTEGKILKGIVERVEDFKDDLMFKIENIDWNRKL